MISDQLLLFAWFLFSLLKAAFAPFHGRSFPRTLIINVSSGFRFLREVDLPVPDAPQIPIKFDISFLLIIN